MGIGSKLSELMEANGTNANELAKKIGVSPQTIYSIIKRDSKKADIEVLSKIAGILGVNIEYFDGTEYTEEELNEIRQFAEFVKKRKAKS